MYYAIEAGSWEHFSGNILSTDVLLTLNFSLHGNWSGCQLTNTSWAIAIASDFQTIWGKFLRYEGKNSFRMGDWDNYIDEGYQVKLLL